MLKYCNIGTVKEFAEALADKTYCSTGENKAVFDFIFLDDDPRLNTPDVTDEEIDMTEAFWYGTQMIYMFDCNYLCLGQWGGDSGVAITSPDDVWYTQDDRESYVESIKYSILKVGDYLGYNDTSNIKIIWRSVE